MFPFHHSSLCLQVSPSLSLSSTKMKCKYSKGAFSSYNRSLVLHSRRCTYSYQWIEQIECNRDRRGRTQSSNSRHNPQTIRNMGKRSVNSLADEFLFGYFWLFFSFFLRLAAILSFSLSCDNALIPAHPKRKWSLPSPCLTLPTKGKLVSFKELNKIQVFQYIFHIPWQHPCIWNKVLK